MSTYRDLVMAAAPDLYWTLQETVGAVAADEVAGHSGTYQAGCTLNKAWQGQRPHSRALYCNGATGGVVGSDQTVGRYGPVSSFTVELWCDGWYLKDVVAKIDVGNADGWRIRGNGTSSPMFTLSRNSRTLAITWTGLPSGLALANAPHHMVFTYDGSLTIAGLNFWLDGSMQTRAGAGTQTLLAGDTFTSTDPLRLLKDGQGDTHYASDLALYPRVLTASEISDHAQWAPNLAAQRIAADAGYVRSASRPAKNLRNISSGAVARKRKRRKINPGLN